MTDMTDYCRGPARSGGAARRRAGAQGLSRAISTRDLAEIYERAGRIKNRRGSITMIPVLSMPSDDITHPIPDLTGYITEGQIVLGARTVQPGHLSAGHGAAVAVAPDEGRHRQETSRARTTPTSPASCSPVYAKALEVRGLAAIIGAEELSDADRRYLQFAEAFEQPLHRPGRRRRPQHLRKPSTWPGISCPCCRRTR